jgi:hypothetical protein
MVAEVRVGGVYSVGRAEGKFGVVKVLAHQPETDIVSTRVFAAFFQVRPDPAWFADRDPGRLDEALGVGLAALPVTGRVFRFWGPELLFVEPVSDAEQNDLTGGSGVAKPWDDLIFA